MLLRFNYFGAGTLVKSFKFAFHCAFAASDWFLRRFCRKIYVSDLNIHSSCVKRTRDTQWKKWLESIVMGYDLVAILNYVLQKIETSSQSGSF